MGVKGDMVMSTWGNFLLGEVRMFEKNRRGELERRLFLLTRRNPYYFAKADGYRVYIHLYGVLRTYPAAYMAEQREDIKSTLKDMVEFFMDTSSDARRFKYEERPGDNTFPDLTQEEVMEAARRLGWDAFAITGDGEEEEEKETTGDGQERQERRTEEW